MKTFSTDFQIHLDSGATTLCWCWRLERNDGLVMGFTDHDRIIEFDGVSYEPASGFEGTQIASSTGLNVDNMDVMGALVSGRLNETDLAAGLFDNALVNIYRVNWADTDQRTLLRSGNLGEVTRAQNSFTAEVRGLTHLLNQPRGRIYQFGCDAVFGDDACGIDVNNASWKGSGTVLATDQTRSFHAGALGGFASGWFAFGKLVWLSGANAGRAMEVKSHDLENSTAAIGLWQPMSEPIAVNDSFEIFAGCDKQFVTCREKFANGLNFRGFPHMPGNDFVLSYPTRDDRSNDGGALNS